MNHTLLPKVVIRAIIPFFKGIASFNILQAFRRIQSNHIFSPLLSFIFLFLFNTTSQAQCGNNNVLVSGSLTPPGVGKTKTLSFKTGEYVLAYCEAGASYTISAHSPISSLYPQITVYSDLGGDLLAQSGIFEPKVTFTSRTHQYVRILLHEYYCRKTGDWITVGMTQNSPSNTFSNIDQPENRTVCHNIMTSPIVFNNSIGFGKLTYYWTNDNPNIGLPSLGTGNIPAFTPINTSDEPITARITVSLTHEYDTIVYTGIPITFTITVNPARPASFTGLDSSYCQNAPPVQLVGIPAGGYFSTIYSSTLTPSNFSVGKYKIKYINPNACPTESPEQTFEIKPVTVVSIIGLKIKTLFCKNDTAITLQGFPSGGIFTIDDVTTSVLDPSVLSVGYHIVKYTYTNSSGCTNSTSQTVEVKTANPVSFTGLDSVYCQYGAPVALTGTPSGGYFLVDDAYYYNSSPLYLSNLNVGRHTISYYNSSACPISVSKTFEIKYNTTHVSIPNIKTLFCKNEPAIILQGTPSGGKFTIDNVEVTVLDPSVLSAGYHTLKYSYIFANGCLDFVNKTIEIRDTVSSVSFTGLDSSYCQSGQGSILTGIPAGGYFLVDGRYKLFNSIIYPYEYTLGRHTIEYIYDVTCPVKSPVKTFEIKMSPDAPNINLKSMFCKSEAPTVLDGFGSPSGGIFRIDGSIASVLDPSKLSIGYHTVSYYYTSSNGCTQARGITIEVREGVAASFQGLDSIYCYNSSPVTLTGFPYGGYFLLDDRRIEGSTLSFSYMSVGKHTVRYVNSIACPTESPIQTFELKTQMATSVSITNLKSSFCENDTAIALQASPSGGIFTIDNQPASVLNPSLLYVGLHLVNYFYKSPDGCSNSDSKVIRVGRNTPVTFTGLDSSYCQNASPVEIQGMPSGGYFLLDGNYIPRSTFTLYPYFYAVGKHTLLYVNNETCAMRSDTQTFEIKNYPRDINILNLKYSFCTSDTAITLQGTPAGGIMTIDGIENSLLDPSKLSLGNHTIRYSYTLSNGCAAFYTRTIVLLKDTLVSFNGLDSSYCNDNSSLVTLTGTPSGGSFIFDDNYYSSGETFRPYNLSIGLHKVRYVNDNTCSKTSPWQTFEIKQTTYTDISNVRNKYCKNENAVTLNGSPTGGIFTIDDIETTVLNPSVLSEGFHIVKYIYTNSESCTHSKTQTIEVRDTSSSILFTGLDSVYCKNAAPVTLKGIPSGGSFLIDGYRVYDYFYPSNYSVGQHTVEYIRYTNEVCLSKSLPQTFKIKALDPPSLSIANFRPIVCKTDTAIILQGLPTGGKLTVDGIETAVFDPSVLSVGNHIIQYSYTSPEGCSASLSQTAEIRNGTSVSLVGLDSLICYNSTPIKLKGSPSGGYFLIDGSYYYTSYSNPEFYPSNYGVGQHTITYLNNYTYNSCPVRTEKVINIIAPPLVTVPFDIRANSTTGKCGSNITYSTPIIGNSTQTSYTFSGATTGQGTGNGSGSFFNIGETQVVVSVRNQCGLYSRSFKVIVVDTEKPTITCPANQDIILGSFECNRVVSFNDPSVSDGCSVSFRRIDTLTQIQSGSSLSAGIYDFKYRATDNSGNTSDCTFKITVNSQNSTANRLNCIPNMTVSLDSKQCYNSIEPAQLLTNGNYYCSNLYSVSISSRDGDGTIPKNYITNDDLGKTIIATVKNNFSQSCTTSITVVDKQAPVLSVLQDTLLSCAELSNGKVLATLSQPNIIYECSKVDFTYQDKVLNPLSGQTGFTVIPANFPIDKSFDYGMGSQSSKIIIRTYTATDEYNNSSTIQRVIYVKNINLSDVTCPKDMTLQCENGNYNASITVTGTPILVNNGRSLQDISCAIDYFYSDETASTSQGYTIKRAWTLIKRGTQERQVCTQTITVVCSNTPLLSISGAINKETGESVSATILLSNGTTDLSQQEGSAYKFLDLPYSDLYRIRAERDNDVLNGVTTYDISRISKHILGLQPLTSPYQMIAADVNKDGSIDGADIIYIRNVLLKRISRFPNNTSWRFIPKNYKFTDETNPFNDDFPEMLLLSKLSGDETQGDFVAVKVGDVNLSSQSQYHSTVVRSSNIDYIDIDDVQLRRGEELIVKLQLNNKRLSSLQMSLKIDKLGVDLLKVTRGDLPEFESINMELDWGASLLRSVWHNPSSGVLKEENTIMYITIKAKKDMWLHDILSVDDLNMVNVSYDTEGEEKSLVLRFKAVEMRNPQFELHQNRPNPFSEETRISFVLPERGVASLEVYDLTGRTVYSVKKSFNKGYNEVILGLNDLPTVGIYFYRLQSDTYSATKKMQVIGH